MVAGKNFLRNEMTGAEYDLGPSMGAPFRLRSGELLDAQRPMEYNGLKGFALKNDPTVVVFPDGSRMQLGVDAEASRKRTLDNLAMSQKQAELAHTQASTDKLQQENAARRAMNVPSGMPMPPKDYTYDLQGNLTVIPNSPTAAKRAKERQEAELQLRTHTDWANAFEKNIEQLIGDPEGKDPRKVEHPGLQRAIGYIDAQVPPLTEAQANARALAEALLAKASVQGLQGIRAAGTAPGSITEKEWPIFQNLRDVLSMKQGEAQYRQQLRDAYMQSRESRARAAAEFNRRFGDGAATAPVAPAAPQAPAQPAPPNADQIRLEAKAAIAAGRSRSIILQQLQSMGIPTEGL